MSRIGCRLAFLWLLSWSIFAAAGDPPLDPPPESDAPMPAAPPAPTPPARPTGDPFQQTPLDRMTPNQRKAIAAPGPSSPAGDAILIQAAEFFRKKDYAQADLAFARAAQAKLNLSADEKVAWGYCKLADLSAKAQSETDPVKLKEIAELTETAKTLGGARLDAAAKQLLERIAAKTATPVVAQNVAPSGEAVPEGWQGLETANFRVVWKSLSVQQAEEVAGVLETVRSAMLARWTGSTASPNWKTRCEVRVHADIASLKAACPKGDEQGCSAVARQGDAVVSRRMDLVAGGGDLLDSVVPREVTFLIVSELFSDEPLSRWAEVGMTAISESPAQVRRYRSTARKYQSSKALFPVATLVKMADFPDPARISEFYAQSVSMVEFLVRRKSAVEFTAMLKETPRRGFEECLKRHYGFANLADFEAQFLRDLSGGK